MAKLSDKFGFEIPEPMDTVNRKYFEKLVMDIDAKVAGDEDLEEIIDFLNKALINIDKKIEDSSNDYNILTSDTFDGSQPVLSSYLANVKKAINDLRKQIIHELRAEDVKTRGSIAGAPYANVQSALEALDKAVKGLKSTDIKHGTSTVSKAISDLDSRIDNISGQVGGEVKANSVKTDRGYQGSARNVESALSSISGKVDGHNSKISANERDIQSMKSDISRNKSDISRNKGSITTLEDKVAKLQSGSEVPLTSDIIRHSSRNIKATNVQDALEELFTYADDTHAKWASSVGSPLSKVDTAEVKEKKTKDLVNKVIKTAKHYVEYPDNIKSLQDIDEEINNRYRVFWESVGQEERYLFKMDFGRKVRIKIKELHQIIGFYVLIKEQSGNHSNLFYMGGNHYVPISSRGVLSYGSVSVNRVTNEVTIETDTIHYPDGYSQVVVLYRKKMDDIDLISHEEFM